MRDTLDAAAGGSLRLFRLHAIALASCGVVIVGFFDYLTGYEISVSVFYLAPVALVAWYRGRRAAVAFSALSCVAWYLSDTASAHPYSYSWVPVWNALVRFGFLACYGLLLAVLRQRFETERRLGRTDDLTGLLNRRAFWERLEYSVALARRGREPMTLAYIDLDDFKHVNDTHGHAAGDRALRTVGRVLAEGTRRSDTVARLGGDEFGLLLPDTGRPGGEEIVAKLRERLQAAVAADGFDVTCSVGAVTFHRPPATADEAVRAADALMYEVKSRGKDSAVFIEKGAQHAEPGQAVDGSDRG